MKTIYLGKERASASPCVATIGFFDGVHRGHQYLIHQVVEEARKSGMESTVITFDRHPRQVLQQSYQPRLLTHFEEKLLLLSKTGIDNCIILPFSKEMAALSAQQFMQQILHDMLQVKKLCIGYDNRFGHNREEGFEQYVAYGKEMGIDVIQAKAFSLNGVNISSSVIRSFLQEGEVEMAERCLGYPYFIRGKVVEGVQEGRRLGFPTANIIPCDEGKLIPSSGVYAVNTLIDNQPEVHHSMMNIGTRPTYGENAQTLEVHILDYEGDLYGHHLAVSFIHRLRQEQKFSNTKELQRQLKADKKDVENYFAEEHQESSNQ